MTNEQVNVHFVIFLYIGALSLAGFMLGVGIRALVCGCPTW